MTVGTVVKTIGSGGDFTVLQAWNDAAPADLTTAQKWAGTFGGSGSFAQGESVSFVGSGATGKVVDSDNSTYVVFGITSGTPVAGDVCTGTTRTCTLTGSAIWNGIIWQGQIKNKTDVFTNMALNLGSGLTTSATCYPWLTTAPGASFRDDVNAQTNALRYDESLGCALKNIGGSYTSVVAVSGTAYARVSNIQAYVDSSPWQHGINASGGGRLTLENCIQEYLSNFGIGGYFAGVCSNCVFISRSAALLYDVGGYGNAKFLNCTFVHTSDSATAASAVDAVGGYPSFAVFKNCAFFGFTAVAGTVSGMTFTNCFSDAASRPTGVSYAAYDTSTGSRFQGITEATRDFRLKSTSALIDAGISDADTTTYASHDIVGTSRPQGAGYDVGAWEYIALVQGIGPFPSYRLA